MLTRSDLWFSWVRPLSHADARVSVLVQDCIYPSIFSAADGDPHRRCRWYVVGRCRLDRSTRVADPAWAPGLAAFGNIAGALGPTIYASAIPALSAGEPITNLPPTATSAEDGFPLWAELARRDALMGIVVLGSWAIFEGVERWVNRMESTVLRGRGTTLGQRRVSGASPATLGWAEEGGPLLAGEGSDVDDEG